jgi:hypothetical protein
MFHTHLGSIQGSIHVCIHVYIYIYMNAFTCIYIHIHFYIHMYIHKSSYTGMSHTPLVGSKHSLGADKWAFQGATFGTWSRQ